MTKSEELISAVICASTASERNAARAAFDLYANGPVAPARRRRRRVSEKLRKRGGYMRCRGLAQNWLRAWPELAKVCLA